MKKILILILLFLAVPVFAANYELKEYIPTKVETTIVTNHFSYRDFYFDGEENINFKSIKNVTKDALPVSISIALFDEDHKNIGTINYCDDSEEALMTAKEERSFYIPVKDYLIEGKKVKDIHYISVLDDNITCKKKGNDYYSGQSMEQIGVVKNTGFDVSTKYLLYILAGLVIVSLALFLYKYMFTNAYQNVDGDDLRKDYKKFNKQLQQERERELKENPPVPPEVVPTKSEQVLEEERIAATEDQSNTNLHNLYK